MKIKNIVLSLLLSGLFAGSAAAAQTEGERIPSGEMLLQEEGSMREELVSQEENSSPEELVSQEEGSIPEELVSQEENSIPEEFVSQEENSSPEEFGSQEENNSQEEETSGTEQRNSEAHVFSKWEYLSDMRELMRHVEQIHPAFELGKLPQDYEQVKKEILARIREGVTAEDFSYLKARYLAMLQDAHTSGNLIPTGERLALSYRICDGAVHLLDEQGQITPVTVVTIGGIRVSSVFQTVNSYFPTENETAREEVFEAWGMYRRFLEEAHCNLKGDRTEVLLKNGQATWTVWVGFSQEAPQEDAVQEDKPSIYGGLIDGGIYYIGLNTCEDNAQVDEQCVLLQQAIAGGCNKVILDVRGNDGGTWSCPFKLFASMTMRQPTYGIYSRYSDYLQEQFPQYTRETFAEIIRDMNTSIVNPYLRLVVLTDENTFGTAMMIGTWVQDGRLGKVIGRVSKNAPTAYGDPLPYTMRHTGETVDISYRYFRRPNALTYQDRLVPDIKTAEGEDILARAVLYLMQ